MRRTVGIACISLGLLLSATSAMADRGGWRRDHGVRHHPGHGHHHGHIKRSSDWVAPLLFLGLAGAVVHAAAQPPAPPPPPVTVLPTVIVPAPSVALVPPPAPAAARYFCGSVGQFYPNTAYCPEGWQLVQR